MTEPIQSNIEAYTEGIVVACRRPDGRWLFIRRSATVRRPLRVCFPGGWIEAGESQAEAVVREMREELHADVVPVRCVWQHLFGDPPRTLWGWLAELTSATPAPNPTWKSTKSSGSRLTRPLSTPISCRTPMPSSMPCSMRCANRGEALSPAVDARQLVRSASR